MPSEPHSVLINDAEQLIEQLRALSELETTLSEHDNRIIRYMRLEALRAIGHVELQRIISLRSAHFLDQDHRPFRLKTENLNDGDDHDRLTKAVGWMCEAEEVLPTTQLYCDLAESYMLLGEFRRAGGYARHATLQRDKLERAFYLASESYFLSYLHEGAEDSLRFAQKYAESYLTPTLPEFISLQSELRSLEKRRPPNDLSGAAKAAGAI